MIALYTSLFEAVKNNMNILYHFFNITKNIDYKNTLPNFFADEFKNIVDSWLFMKLDYDNFNVHQAVAKSDLNDNFKNFLAKIYKKKSMSIYVDHIKGDVDNEELKKKIQSEKKNIIDNAPNATKFTLKNIGDYSKMVDTKLIFPKLKKFRFDNGKIREEDFNMKDSMPELEKLSIRNSPNFEIYFLEKFPKNLKRLYLERCNFVNKDLSILMEIFNDRKGLKKE